MLSLLLCVLPLLLVLLVLMLSEGSTSVPVLFVPSSGVPVLPLLLLVSVPVPVPVPVVEPLAGPVMAGAGGKAGGSGASHSNRAGIQSLRKISSSRVGWCDTSN